VKGVSRSDGLLTRLLPSSGIRKLALLARGQALWAGGGQAIINGGYPDEQGS